MRCPLQKSIGLIFLFFALLISPVRAVAAGESGKKVRIKAIGIPLADHYAGVVAYEKYRDKMKYADYRLILLPGPNLVRAYFYSEPDADIAFNVAPMVMDMFAEKPDFRWISLIHRDGNALAVNTQLEAQLDLPADRISRRPDRKIAEAFGDYKKTTGRPVECAVPSPLATHTTILYKYLKDHDKTLSFDKHDNADVLAVVVKPPKSPEFLKRKAARAEPAALEQSLPWAEKPESEKFGTVGWYSKDVLKHPNGHVECVVIAKNDAIRTKRRALQEVVFFIHRAGQDIETARRKGGEELDRIVAMIRKHIPKHSREAIRQSLRADLNVINYKNLSVDAESMASLAEIMELAVEAGLLKEKIDIGRLADMSFATEITKEKR